MSRRFLFAAWMSVVGVAGCAGGGGGGTGDCAEPCGSTQVCCDGRCVFTQIDVNHCGGCGMTCSGTCGGGVCTPGAGADGGARDAGMTPTACSPECAANQRCCGGNCVPLSQPANVDGRPSAAGDPRSPFNHCNGCSRACDPQRAVSCSIRAGAGAPECACGDFGQCPTGDLCVNDGGRWQCVSTSTNPRNCGALGTSCADGESCVGGMCVCGATGTRCSAGQACCDGRCIDTSNDAANCGGCGVLCTPNAPNCTGGNCTCAAAGRACTAPMFGIGAMPGESCCPGMGCVANTSASCNCMPCASGESCAVSTGGLLGGTGMVEVCCGDPIFVAASGCGGFGFPGGDGGFGFPGGDGGGFGFDGGLPFP